MKKKEKQERAVLTITKKTNEKLNKLSKKYRMSKAKIIESIIENIEETQLEKIIILPNAKEIFPKIFNDILKD